MRIQALCHEPFARQSAAASADEQPVQFSVGKTKGEMHPTI
jgi:hypothetical protein